MRHIAQRDKRLKRQRPCHTRNLRSLFGRLPVRRFAGVDPAKLPLCLSGSADLILRKHGAKLCRNRTLRPDEYIGGRAGKVHRKALNVRDRNAAAADRNARDLAAAPGSLDKAELYGQRTFRKRLLGKFAGTERDPLLFCQLQCAPQRRVFRTHTQCATDQ